MKENKPRPWMLVGTDLRKDAPFFIPMGLLFGIVQFVGYNYFDNANWGGDLLIEQIPIYFLFFANIFLWSAKGIVVWQHDKRELRGLHALIGHVRSRTVGFASASASTMAGFSIAPALWGAYWHGVMFLIFSAYLLALGEVAANPFSGESRSRTHLVALFALFIVPAIASLRAR